MICLVLFIFATAVGMTTLRTQDHQPQRKKAQYPIVDYNAPEPADPDKRTKRREKGKKYDNAPFPVDPRPEIGDQMQFLHFPPDINALPAAKSAAVVVGKVADAAAYLSPAKTGVYTEFQVAVEEVVKNDGKTPLGAGDAVCVERPGGRVRTPAGHIQEYRTTLNPLEVGARYALFLVRRENDFVVLTGYKLEAGVVSPLDDLPVFGRYKGMSEGLFLQELRGAAKAHADGWKPTDTSPAVSAQISEEPVESPPPDPTPDPGTDCQFPPPPPCT